MSAPTLLPIVRAAYRPEDLIEVLGLGRGTVYRLLESGQIPGAFKVGKCWIISKSRVDQWLDDQAEAFAAQHQAS